MSEDEIVARAQACVGTCFRLHGRAIGHGLDCVGVVAHAFGLRALPAGYALRGGTADAIAAAARRAGLVPCGDGRAGRLLLLAPGDYQHHLAVTTPAGFVHADAGLRRVVEVPGKPCWPVVAAWRMEG